MAPPYGMSDTVEVRAMCPQASNTREKNIEVAIGLFSKVPVAVVSQAEELGQS